jgi:hypothetical protein
METFPIMRRARAPGLSFQVPVSFTDMAQGGFLSKLEPFLVCITLSRFAFSMAAAKCLVL